MKKLSQIFAIAQMMALPQLRSPVTYALIFTIPGDVPLPVLAGGRHGAGPITFSSVR